jgi:hypothetical protein
MHVKDMCALCALDISGTVYLINQYLSGTVLIYYTFFIIVLGYILNCSFLHNRCQSLHLQICVLFKTYCNFVESHEIVICHNVFTTALLKDGCCCILASWGGPGLDLPCQQYSYSWLLFARLSASSVGLSFCIFVCCLWCHRNCGTWLGAWIGSSVDTDKQMELFTVLGFIV